MQGWVVVGGEAEAGQVGRDKILFKKFFLFIFLATPTACRSSWARNRTHTTAVTLATAVMMLDS